MAYADDDTRNWALAGYEFSAVTPYTLRSSEELERELNHIRESGLARDSEQLHIGLYSISAPLFIGGQVEVALSLTVPIERFLRNEKEYISALQ